MNPRIVSTLALVFTAGVATGMLAMQYGLHEKLRHTVAAAPPAEANREEVLHQFRTKLDLSSEQTEKIALVLEDYRHYYESLQDQIDDLRPREQMLREQIEDLRSTGQARILQILDPGQQVRFKKMMVELLPQLDSAKK
jgi:predicted  nucleic acid-binding Zn-ribbon protein